MPIPKLVNQDFFKTWTPEMAYVLGFFAADGNMIKNNRGAHFMEFVSTDRDIIEKIHTLLGSNHKITRRIRDQGKPSYRLQIGSKEIFEDLIHLGMTPNKSLSIKMPIIPNKYLSHFVRGYFDGDGHVSQCRYQKNDRKNKSNTIITGFTSGSKMFLEGLLSRLKNYGITTGGSLYLTDGYHLCFSTRDSFKLYDFMYRDCEDLNLERKRSIFEHYFDIGRVV